MKLRLALSLFTLTAALAVQADEIKLSGVHLCCGSCVKGVEKAAAKVGGASVTVDKDAGTVTISASKKETIQETVNALVHAGYYGKSSDGSIKLADSGAKDAKVASLKVEGVHLCCGKCVTAVQNALSKVPGVKGNTAEKNAKTFEVTGDFSAKAVFSALQDAGLTGSVAK
ncbi:MAG: hypothetical protein EBS05_03945 [Proteobacteria bacterium]|nr:hypothetical protein [Pseudomonadota bacterium]